MGTTYSWTGNATTATWLSTYGTGWTAGGTDAGTTDSIIMSTAGAEIIVSSKASGKSPTAVKDLTVSNGSVVWDVSNGETLTAATVHLSGGLIELSATSTGSGTNNNVLSVGTLTATGGTLSIDYPGTSPHGTTGLNVTGTGISSISGTTFLNSSGVTVTSGTLNVSSAISDQTSGKTGTLNIGASGTLGLSSTVTGQTISFGASTDAGHVGEKLVLSAGATLSSSTIANLAKGDTINLGTRTLTSVTGSGTSFTLTLSDASTLSLTTTTASAITLAQLSADDGTSSVYVACFARGTRIATPEGDIEVQALSIGDQVTTVSGASRPVKWIGRRSYGAHFVAANRHLWPVLIRKNALADGVPGHDLHVSAKHALFIDGALVPAGLLVNGASITHCPTYGDVSYFHVELDSHDVILAEGAPAETFVDDDSRGMFHNAAEFFALYGEDSGRLPLCAKRLETGPELATIRGRIAARAGLRTELVASDPDLHLLVDGKPVRAETTAQGFASFTVKPGAQDIRIVSRTVVPAELGLSDDCRTLGVAVRAVSLRSASCHVELAPGNPALRQGFHAAEATHRWTNGEALLPAQALAAFPAGCTLDVAYLPLPEYPVFVPLAA
jgi:O-antigen biosynthesis protein